MKKLFIILLAVLLMGCEIDALNYYQEAIEKSETIKDGQSKLDIELDIELSDELKETESEFASLISHVVFSNQKQFGENKSISRQYIGTDALGVDMVYYNNEGSEFVKIPFLGKYLPLDEMMLDEIDTTIYDKPPYSEESIQQISQIWTALVQEEDVVNLGDEVIDTPEGEVKVKKLVVSFSHDQIHQFLNDALIIISVDEVFKEEVKDYPMYGIQDGKLITSDQIVPAEDIIKGTQMLLDSVIVEDFEMITYIDIDKYIIQYEYNMKFSFKGVLESILNNINIKAAYQLYDIHQEQILEFPTLDESNKTTIEEIIDTLGEFSIE